PAPAEEVVADVGGPVLRILLWGRPRALDALEGRPDLGLPRRLGQLLHRVAVAVAAREVHARVHARGIAVQDVLHEAHALEVLGPVDGRAQAQAGDRVGDRDLAGGFALVLGVDGLLGRQALRGEPILQPGAQLGRLGPVLPHTL